MSLILIVLAAWGIGGPTTRYLSCVDPLEAFAARLLTGLVPVAWISLFAGSVSLLATQVLLAAIAVGVALWQWVDKQRAHSPGTMPSTLSPLSRVSMAVVAVAGGLTLLGALAPVTNWDACVAHLALPSDYARVGHIYTHPGNVYSGYPHFLHALYAVAFYSTGGGHELPVSLLNWGLGLVACLALYSLGRRIGTPQTGLVAAALLSTAPIYMDQAGGVGIDMPFVAYSTMALAALTAWQDKRERGWLLLAAFLAGSACGIRHTGGIVILLLLAGVAIHGASGSRWKASATFAIVAFAAALPWLARTWLVTGNPVFPFFLSLFPESPIDHIAISTPGAHESIESSGGVSLLALLRFPWDIVMRPQDYDGWSKSPGGMILVLGIPGLIVGGIRCWWLGAYSAAGGVVFFYFQRLARYILPFFTPMMVVAALAVERVPRGKQVLAALVCAYFFYGLALHGAAIHFKVGVVLGAKSKTEYLAERVERYGAFQYANQHLNDGGILLTVDQRSYYIDGPTFQNHWSLKRIARESLETQVAWLHEQDIRYVMIPVDFVEESGALSGDIADMLRSWRASPAHFEALGPPLQLARRGGQGMEEVAFYAVR